MSKREPSRSARQTALKILHAVDANEAYTDVALRQTLQHTELDRRDRAFITECVYGVVRWQGRIDWLLQHVCKRPLDSLTPWIRNTLRLGTYQCFWMDRVPQHAAVHESVNLARHYGHQGTARLVNGVLRSLLRQHETYCPPDASDQPVDYLSITYSHPKWLVERWLYRYGWDRTQALCEANNCPAGVTLRPNSLRLSQMALAHRLEQEGMAQITPSTVGPQALIVQRSERLDQLPSYADGLFQVQDEGAMLVAPLCRVEPGHHVLDACAAPGGKTTHLAQLMQDSGHLIALDKQPGRLHLLQQNTRRLGLSCITLIAADATRTLPVQQQFERILIDAPCSGLGVLRRHPDIKWRKSATDLKALQTVQLELLHHLLPHLKPDKGLLIYSVCTNEPEETHDVVTQFLYDHPAMVLEPIDPSYPQPLSISSATAGTLDLTPDQLGTEGVFVARFRYRPIP